jgi:hypothetical protein
VDIPFRRIEAALVDDAGDSRLTVRSLTMSCFATSA